RNYLEVTTPKHRDALVSIVLSTHKLAVECLRWTTPTTEHENRRCRMCMANVETHEYVLFRCIGDKNNDNELGRRQCVWSDLARMAPLSAPREDTVLLKSLQAHRPSIEVNVKYCYRVLKILYKLPM
ncbi:uncharacterized protein EV420DRAFT_1217895, partial [Desarmillaria tabescens]